MREEQRGSLPEPCPAGSRARPPLLPPAPPGGGTGGPPPSGPFRRGSGDAPGEPDLVVELLPLLSDLAVARSTFETIDCYPDDRALRSELMSIIEDARRNLLNRLDTLLERIASEQEPFTDEALCEFHSSLLYSSQALGSFSGIRSREAVRPTPPREFVLLVINHVKRAVRSDASYHSGAAFDAEVFNDFQVLLYAAQLASMDG